MRARLGRAGAVVAFFALFLQPAAPAQDAEDWSSSPEAYFLTSEERAEWKTLDSRDSRQKFIERYWLKRDPTPGTERNEFRETVLARIKTADERFRIEKTPGSRTARGFVFIVFGTPARFTDSHPIPPAAPRPPGASGPGSPVGWVEGSETTSTWVYDRQRTPRVLEALDKPSLEITFVIEPNRRKDNIQNPGLVNELREILARKSIVNPDLIPPANPGTGRNESSVAGPAKPTLIAEARAWLKDAPQTSRGPQGSVLGSAVLWRETGPAETFVWFFLPQSEGTRTFHALIRSEENGAEIEAISEPASSSKVFSASAPGVVVTRRFALAPGVYTGAFAVVEQGNERRVAAASTSFRVPSVEREFAVSSTLLTRGPAAGDPVADPLFSLGGARIPPRADAVFLRSESLWYFLEVANPVDAAKVSIEARLRRGNEQVGALAQFPAKLQKLALGRYLFGNEMPLATLEPGDYVIYLTVHAGDEPGAEYAVRRAEFRVQQSNSPH